MLRHVVLIKWTDDATPEQTASAVSALRALPAAVPEIRAYEVGTDLGLRDGTYDVGIVAQFDDADGWRAYLGHPAHVAVLADLISPIAANRVSVQFQL